MERLFASVGPGMEHLGVLGKISMRGFLQHRETQCRSLRSLKIADFNQRLGDDQVQLVVSYPTQLERI